MLDFDYKVGKLTQISGKMPIDFGGFLKHTVEPKDESFTKVDLL